MGRNECDGSARRWRRLGRKRFRYVDSKGQAIDDAEQLERIRNLVIPPAWTDVWISPNTGAKLQATGTDAAERRQYLYHASFRAAQERRFESLLHFAESLPMLRGRLSQHLRLGPYEREWACAIAVSLVNRAWFRVGSERHARASGAYEVTTLTKRHVTVSGNEIEFHWRATRERLHREGFPHLGGTLLAAAELAKQGPAAGDTEATRVLAQVMRKVSNELGNTPAVARASYVSPAVVEHYRVGCTIEDFRRKTRRPARMSADERALLRLLRADSGKRRSG